VYLAYAGFGAGFAGCSLIISSTLVTRWFHRRRSVALSVSSTGLSVGGILLTPAATALIDQRGFATASLWIAAAFVLGVVPVTALVLRPGPSALGLLPDGDPSPAATGAGPAVGGGVPFAEAVRGTLFRRITVTWTLALIAQVGGISHLFSLVDERVDRPAAALAVSVLAGSSMVGRLAGGWLLGRVALRPACLTWLVLQACGLSGLALVEGRAGLLVSASLFGLSVGNVLLLQPVVLADVFGVRDYPRIFARSQLVSTVGIASGPFLLGILRDAADGYRLAFLACDRALAGRQRRDLDRRAPRPLRGAARAGRARRQLTLAATRLGRSEADEPSPPPLGGGEARRPGGCQACPAASSSLQQVSVMSLVTMYGSQLAFGRRSSM
jgi:MFS family permease